MSSNDDESKVYVNLGKPKKSSKKQKPSDDELVEERGLALGRLLGQGSYCKVRSAIYEGEEVAVKIINRKTLSRQFDTKFLPREIDTLCKVRHENIVNVYKIFDFPKKVYIVMELLPNDLLRYVRARGQLSETEARVLFVQIVSAVKHLHGLKIAHRDLKCENIMIDDDHRAKIIDFGFCRSTVDNDGHKKMSETFCGSTAYAAPEVLQGLPYNPMFYDVWSLGCVLYIMTTGLMPYDDSHTRKMVLRQLNREINFLPSAGLSHSLKDLIRHMLEPDVMKRFTLDHVSHSQWFNEQGEPEEKRIIRKSKNMKNLVSTATQVNLSDDDS